MKIDEANVVVAMEIPSEGDGCFNTTSIKEIDFRSFLKEEHQNMKWQKDIPRTYLEEK